MATEALEIISVENSKIELSSMPLKSSIVLKISHDASHNNAKDYIRVVKHSTLDGIKELPHSYSDFKTFDHLMFVDLKTEYKNGELHISPIDMFEESKAYSLYIGVGFKTYSITKDERISSIELSNPTLIDGKTIKIEALSAMSVIGGKSTFIAKITSGTDVISNTIAIQAGVPVVILNNSIVISDSKPIAKGDSLEYSASITSMLDKDYVLSFKTATANKIEDINSEFKSEVISRDDVVNFFKNPFNGNSSLPTTPQPAQENPVSSVKLIHPNKIVYEFNESLDITTVSENNISIDFSEAFGNYTLPRFGFYNPDQKYIVNILFKKANKVMEIIINEDVDNEVPDTDKYIIKGL